MRLKQEDLEFKANLGYTTKLCQKERREGEKKDYQMKPRKQV
jgi:hypothetical protein